MIIDRDELNKYKTEYGVQIRRFAELLALTSSSKESMGMALSEFGPSETITEHVNKPYVEEVFLLLDGTADFVLDGVSHPIRAGDMGFARIGQRHSFVNTSDSKIRLLSIWWRSPAASA